MRYLETSVIIAAVRANDPHHDACARLLRSDEELATSTHALMECFSVLTGGGASRIDPDHAALVLEANLTKRVQMVSLSPREVFHLMKLCRERGVRGGAIYDFQHLAAARKASAEVLHTLDVTDLRAFAREGDPRIEMPG
jgi:predicted nucleic acid-binding protein